jgi:hypothetical protein
MEALCFLLARPCVCQHPSWLRCRKGPAQSSPTICTSFPTRHDSALHSWPPARHIPRSPDLFLFFVAPPKASSTLPVPPFPCLSRTCVKQTLLMQEKDSCSPSRRGAELACAVEPLARRYRSCQRLDHRSSGRRRDACEATSPVTGRDGLAARLVPDAKDRAPGGYHGSLTPASISSGPSHAMSLTAQWLPLALAGVQGLAPLAARSSHALAVLGDKAYILWARSGYAGPMRTLTRP